MIYPDIETHRRDSDSFDISEFRQSNLERNCSQIFAKGPALTREIFEKMNMEIVPQKTYLLGYELNTKKILFISGLFLLFFTSFFGAIVMWFTDFFDDTVFSTLAISNTSTHYKLWTNPTPKPTLSVYIFNYTNLEEYESRLEDKLRVQEVGPYVYEETLERVNITFNDDDTVSFREKRAYKFRPDLSKGRQSDRVNVPNIPLIAGASITKHYNYFARLAFSSVLTGLGEKAFVNLAADSMVMGYTNDLYDISKSVAKLNNQKPFEKFGLLAGKMGVQPFLYTMNTGKRNIDRLGVIEKVNGKEQFDYWSTDECNRLKSADGAVYPPKLVQNKQPLHYLFPQMCRTIPMVFEKEITILDGQIPAYRFVVPEDIYDAAEEIAEHQCYCSMESGECPLKGVFNVTPCSMGAPLYVSHPHFYRADKSLFNGVSGLSDAKRDLQTYADVHPIMGFVMAGKTRTQVNVRIQKAFGVYQLDRYEDGLMLPVAWVEGALDEKTLPQDFLDVIYEATYTYKGVKMAFQYGFLLTTLITLICLVLAFKSRWEDTTRINTRHRARV